LSCSICSFNVKLCIIVIVCKSPHLQRTLFELFFKPDSQTVEITSRHHIASTSVCHPYIICYRKNCNYSTIKLEVFVVTNYRLNFLETHIVIKYGSSCQTFKSIVHESNRNFTIDTAATEFLKNTTVVNMLNNQYRSISVCSFRIFTGFLWFFLIQRTTL
jgi:hypothetical protein